MAPTTLKLRVSRVNPTVLTIATQVMRAIAFAVSMASTFVVAVVANTVTSSYLMTFLAAPVTVSLDGSGAVFLDQILSISDFAFAKCRCVSVEIT